MRMARRMHIRPRLMNLAMDGKRRGIDRLVPHYHTAFLVHQYQIRHADLAEMLRERVQPEMVRQDWVANGDVACDAFVEACTTNVSRRVY